MRRRKLYSLILILIISFLSFGQTNKSELITFKDQSFIKSLQNIIKPKNNCETSSNNHNWYIKRQKDDSYLVSINRIENLLKTLENKYIIYTTIINNPPLARVCNSCPHKQIPLKRSVFYCFNYHYYK